MGGRDESPDDAPLMYCHLPGSKYNRGRSYVVRYIMCPMYATSVVPCLGAQFVPMFKLSVGKSRFLF